MNARFVLFAALALLVAACSTSNGWTDTPPHECWLAGTQQYRGRGPDPHEEHPIDAKNYLNERDCTPDDYAKAGWVADSNAEGGWRKN